MGIRHIDTKHSGRVAVLQQDTHISKWVQQTGRLSHDTHALGQISRFIPVGGCVVDVGAFIGDHTEFYAKCVGRTGQVLAIEPNPEAYACLVHNMARYPWVSCFNGAAGAAPGHMELEYDKNVGASYAKEGEGIEVRPLDDFPLAAMNFIKVDCEGMEPLVLQGMEKLVALWKPTLFMEINEGALGRQGFSPSSIYEQLRHWGYLWHNIYEGHRMEGPQFDIVARPLQ